MKKSSIVWLIVIIVIIIIGGYIWWASTSNQYSTTQGSTTTTSSNVPSGSTTGGANSGTNSGTNSTSTVHTITLNNTGGGQFGEHLSAANGMTLYQSTKDATNVSNCTGSCATAWPPYTVSAAVAASLSTDPGITGKVATIKRADGSLQVTYRGLPLYFYQGDVNPGDTNGEAVNGFTEVAP